MNKDNYTRGCDIEKLDTACENCSCKSGKLHIYDWLEDLPKAGETIDIVEVRFKNTRKAFFKNVNDLNLKIGDFVAVEASPGHDIGIVSLTGDLVKYQLKKYDINPETYEFKKVYRKAKQADLEKWKESIDLEHAAMLKSREISQSLKLDMKIGDVEYQGDKTKAIFYYIADDRVDFRELIKVLAEQFRIRIEMRQIGARQEAGRIGGIGSCGRELCCSSWITNFVSVTTVAARYQELSLNPQKLAGQCGKLKCCLNFEVDCYIDAQKDFPPREVVLHTKDGPYFHQKTDVFRGVMWYSSAKDYAVNITPVPVERVHEIIALNKKGENIDKLTNIVPDSKPKEMDYSNVVGQDSLTRFEDKNRKKPKRKNKPRPNNNRNPRNNNEN
ncbi:MAG: hypothetical protein JXR58_01740 [Bacteroidales bacterium]|nr:hypothetical protein [Bacteroidales bacterium]